VYNYFDVKSHKVDLLMIHAESEMAVLMFKAEQADRMLQNEIDLTYRTIRSYNSHGVLGAILIVLFLGGLGYLFWQSISGDAPIKNGGSSVPVVAVEKRNSNDESSIQTTLYKVAKDLEYKKDINRDGKVNCIDAALLFYRYFPDKNKVRVYWNRNDAKDFNHLFNLVLFNGEWIGVEPQAKFCGFNSYRMRPIWGDQYDYRLNQDVTDSWLQYLK